MANKTKIDAAKTALSIKLGKAPKALLENSDVAWCYYNMTVNALEKFIAETNEPKTKAKVGRPRKYGKKR